jgi:hypothetical protein
VHAYTALQRPSGCILRRLLSSQETDRGAPTLETPSNDGRSLTYAMMVLPAKRHAVVTSIKLSVRFLISTHGSDRRRRCVNEESDNELRPWAAMPYDHVITSSSRQMSVRCKWYRRLKNVQFAFTIMNVLCTIVDFEQFNVWLKTILSSCDEF